MADDPEILAIGTVMGALEPLDSDAQDRVLDYVFRRLGRAQLRRPIRATLVEPQATATPAESGIGASPGATDIRSLKEQKKPKSANEMAALVAYYLSEMAPPDERTDTIGTTEIEKYFKQARYPLPQVTRNTLSNAATAGYFDSAGRGQYRLNPVGYNLVAHSMPAKEGSPEQRPKRKATTRKKATRKPVRKSTRRPRKRT